MIRWVQIAQVVTVSTPFTAGHVDGVVGCFLVSETLLPAPVLFSYSSFFPFFLVLLLSFPIKLSFFSKALEPLVYRVYGDRKRPDLILLFSCRFGIFHKHRVCQLNIY